MTIFKYTKDPILLHSKEYSNYKIECDSLTDDDWYGLSMIAKEILPSQLTSNLKDIIGIPKGGLPFAKACKEVFTINEDNKYFLIVDDVYTTGNSFKPYAKAYGIGLVAFARKRIKSDWIYPIFELNKY
jgi:adenine/guanine phosphoribosyltransferase-like PRPP-binding protein